MLLRKYVHVLTIYDHEENYDDMINFLKDRTEYIEVERGYKFILEDSTLKRFCDKFYIKF